jgi:hypothetical protein
MKKREPRMMMELPREIQMAIKIRAAKDETTTGAVVVEAMRQVFAQEVEEAKAALAERKKA